MQKKPNKTTIQNKQKPPPKQYKQIQNKTNQNQDKQKLTALGATRLQLLTSLSKISCKIWCSVGMGAFCTGGAGSGTAGCWVFGRGRS